MRASPSGRRWLRRLGALGPAAPFVAAAVWWERLASAATLTVVAGVVLGLLVVVATAYWVVRGSQGDETSV